MLIGTRRGLFRLTASAERRDWRLDGPHIEGYEVYHAVLDLRDGRTAYAAVRHPVWGTHLYRSEDAGASWSPLASRPVFPTVAERQVAAIWHVAPGGRDTGLLYAGVEPAGLFVSAERGEGWLWLGALEEQPTRVAWQPARGGLALHSIQVDPRHSDRVFVALSAGGCYRTEDGGGTWRPVNRGLRADYLPDPYPEAGQCVHSLRLHPAAPDRLYQQTHCGTYRSDDGGDSWIEISEGLPSDFGYVVAVDPSDPDRCWVIPEESSHMRTVCGARLRVFETRDAGATWVPRTDGLPQEHAYVTVLREALATDGLEPCGVYFGTSTGHLYGSRDGESWQPLATHLPKILSVEAGLPSPGS